jgi:hypothetical protein
MNPKRITTTTKPAVRTNPEQRAVSGEDTQRVAQSQLRQLSGEFFQDIQGSRTSPRIQQHRRRWFDIDAGDVPRVDE